MDIIFRKVGRAKKTWNAKIEELSYENMYNEVKKNSALMSRDFHFDFDEEKKTGEIYAGFRKVGEFQVL